MATSGFEQALTGWREDLDARNAGAHLVLVYLAYAVNHPDGYDRDPSVAGEAAEVASWVPARHWKAQQVLEAIHQQAGRWLDAARRQITVQEWRVGPEPLIRAVAPEPLVELALRFHGDYVAARVSAMATGTGQHLDVEDPRVPLHAAAASAAWVAATVTPDPHRAATELGRQVLAELTL